MIVALLISLLHSSCHKLICNVRHRLDEFLYTKKELQKQLSMFVYLHSQLHTSSDVPLANHPYSNKHAEVNVLLW